jgi:hypothetical protein
VTLAEDLAEIHARTEWRARLLAARFVVLPDPVRDPVAGLNLPCASLQVRHVGHRRSPALVRFSLRRVIHALTPSAASCAITGAIAVTNANTTARRCPSRASRSGSDGGNGRGHGGVTSAPTAEVSRRRADTTDASGGRPS